MYNKFLFIISVIFISFFFSCNPEDDSNDNKNDTSNNDISKVPEWSKEVVWYQIFVERFSNGDTTNDPTAHDLIGTYPDFIPDTWTTTAWNSDWYKLQDYEIASPA